MWGNDGNKESYAQRLGEVRSLSNKVYRGPQRKGAGLRACANTKVLGSPTYDKVRDREGVPVRAVTKTFGPDINKGQVAPQEGGCRGC